jgi:hypothetical protein
MSRDTIVWLSVVLFMVHEFEEIIFIRPWLSRFRDDPRARRQAFWGFRSFSTPTLAAMIFEEFVLFSLIALVSVVTGYLPLIAGFLIPYALHLLGHVLEALRLRMRTPSAVTAALTLPWYGYAIWALASGGRAWEAIAWAVGLSLVISANFDLIYRLRPRLERRLFPEGGPLGVVAGES